MDISKNYIPLDGIRTAEAAKAKANEVSLARPGCYVIIVNDFGYCLSVSKRLNVFAPSDAAIKSYWLNGTEKPFTSAQKIADQNATPVLS